MSVVVDDVAALVYFQHGLELGVGDDVHSVRQRVAEMQFYTQVALFYQMEAGAIALVGGSGQNRRRCSRAGSRCESVHSPRPATSWRSSKFGWKGLEGICRPSTYTAWKLMVLFLA